MSDTTGEIAILSDKTDTVVRHHFMQKREGWSRKGAEPPEN